MWSIEAAQSADGGWPYCIGKSSWTEPSALALLSGLGFGMSQERIQSGAAWLKASQNRDGGWSPRPDTGPSTWVTALAALLPAELIGGNAHRAAVEWLVEQTGLESSLTQRVRQWMLGNQELSQGASPGWPWFPGAAAWVMPTAISLLALRKEQTVRPARRLKNRIDEGTQFLLSHACAEGGWNHGATHALGYQAKAYPETTGVGLLALRGVRSLVVERGIAVAEEFLGSPHPAGISWLRLGLAAHSRPVEVQRKSPPACRLNVADQALAAICEKPDVLYA